MFEDGLDIYQGLRGCCTTVQATSKGEKRQILGGRRVETTTFGGNWICCDQTLYAKLQDGGRHPIMLFLWICEEQIAELRTWVRT